MLLDVWEANANQDSYILIRLVQVQLGGGGAEYISGKPSNTPRSGKEWEQHPRYPEADRNCKENNICLIR